MSIRQPEPQGSVVPFPASERLPTMEECIREARAFRKRVVDEIQYLIDFLDDLDGDPDFEIQCEDEGAQCDDEGAPEYEGAHHG